MATTKNPFDKKFLNQQKKLLVDERSSYLRSVSSIDADLEEMLDGQGHADASFDEDGGEGAGVAVERDFGKALSAQAQEAVREIDAALARIDEGTYGICEVSGEPIPRERLEAIPWTRVRIEHKVSGLGVS